MKKFFAVVATTSFLGLSVPASAHHMAEGIVSDDVWEMINDLLEAADSPHLDMDLSSIVMDRTLTTTVELDMSEVPVTADEVVDWIVAGIEDANTGELGVNIDVTYTCDSVEPICLFTISERIGAGDSQVEPVTLDP
jgi:hypothetical protein